MTLKSDRWIKEKCTMPQFMVQDKGKWHTSYLSPEVLCDMHSRRIIDSVRHLTAEEQAAWVPMISPFTPGQVRQRERAITPAERAAAVAGNNAGTCSAADLMAVLPGNTVSVRHDQVTGLQALEKIISYGTSSFGYDVTLADEFQIFTNINSAIIDPLNFSPDCLHSFKGDVCIIPPHSYILGYTREYFKIPRNVTGVALGKSTYARCGAIVNVTPIEAGFEGTVVIEIANTTSLPLKVYANMGIAQFLFFESDEECEVSYADRAGKYQGQTGMQLALV